ncbi:Protein maelstrom 2 [Halotydeus destructor]|nr:Protein maelstrom 2 [Halotydeus destructor]
MAKKGKKQPFICFVNAQQDALRSTRGHVAFDQLIAELGPVWAEMDEKARAPYLKMSKHGGSFRPIGYQVGPLNSQGRPVQEEYDEEMEASGVSNNLEQIIKHYVTTPDIEEVKKKKFYIMSFNVMVVTHQGDYYPIELGVAEYSIEQGITKYMQRFIDPGPVPPGYMAKAKEHCESSHKIPFMGFADGVGHGCDANERKQAFSSLLLDLNMFLSPSTDEEDYLYVFALNEGHRKQNIECLKAIVAQTKDDDRALFEDIFGARLYNLDVNWLLFNLCSKSNQVLPYPLCEDAFKVSSYDYSANTNCTFHTEQDNSKCALGLARRICYMMSDVVLPRYKVEPIANQHLPVQEDHSVSVTTDAGSDWGTWSDKPRRSNQRPSRSTLGSGEVQEDVRVLDAQRQQPNHSSFGMGPPSREARSRSPHSTSYGRAESVMSEETDDSWTTRGQGDSRRPQPITGPQDPRRPAGPLEPGRAPSQASSTSSSSTARRGTFGRGRRPQ